jgi:hypothetical protein
MSDHAESPWQQGDLFSMGPNRPWSVSPDNTEPAGALPAELDDAALIVAIEKASQHQCLALAHEAGSRRLAAAIPALEKLCRRFTGFGLDHAVREQMAALEGLQMVGGVAAAAAVARLIGERTIVGPGLARAVAAAAGLGAKLPNSVLVALLQHPSPEIRADACRCAHGGAEVLALIRELTTDLNTPIAAAAACALARSGQVEVRPALVRLLHTHPTAEVVTALAEIADDDCLVLLGRVGRSRPDLADIVIDSLEGTDRPRAAPIAAALRRARAGTV